MFLGHFAAGFAAKRFAPRASLGTYFFAAQMLDLIWPVLVIAGVEKVEVELTATQFTPLNFVFYPYSHSLLMCALWSAVAAGVYFAVTKQAKETVAVAGLVMSHWFLDWASHREDMPILLFGELKTGLGLWNSTVATLAVEGGLFVAGVIAYLTVRPKWAANQWFWGLVLLLAGIFLMNAFGPKPPENAPAFWLAAPALGMWLFVVWAAVVDREK